MCKVGPYRHSKKGKQNAPIISEHVGVLDCGAMQLFMNFGLLRSILKQQQMQVTDSLDESYCFAHMKTRIEALCWGKMAVTSDIFRLYLCVCRVY